MAQKKSNAGRKTLYNANYHPKLVYLCAQQGMTDTQAAEYMGISERTLNYWKKQHEEFLQAYKNGSDEKSEKVVGALFKRALGYDYEETELIEDDKGGVITKVKKKHMAANPVSIFFWLTNKRPDEWRHRQENIDIGDKKVHVTFEVTDSAEEAEEEDQDDE